MTADIEPFIIFKSFSVLNQNPLRKYRKHLQLHAAGRSGIRGYVADIGNTREVHQDALEAEAETGVFNSAVFTKVKIPLVLAHVHAEIFNFLSENIITFLALAAADDLSDTGNKQIRCRNGFSVIIEAHIEALDFCGVVREEHRTMVNLFADIAFVLGLQIAAPENGILELLAGCLKQFNSFCV